MCGVQDQILLNKTGDKMNLNLRMPPASVCVFNLRASCGLPAFTPNDTQSPDIDISYVQFEDNDS
jgi:hypothetical protein